MQRKAVVSLIVSAGLLAVPQSAQAYIGPGAGLAAIGTVLALLGAILLAMVGFVWYPIKRLRSRLKKRSDPAKSDRETMPS